MIKVYKVIMYSGVLAFLFLILTFVLGITELNFKLHKIGATLAFVFGLIHVGLILYRNIKAKIKR